MTSTLFWDFTQHILVLCCLHFGKSYRSHLQGSSYAGRVPGTLRLIHQDQSKGALPAHPVHAARQIGGGGTCIQPLSPCKTPRHTNSLHQIWLHGWIYQGGIWVGAAPNSINREGGLTLGGSWKPVICIHRWRQSLRSGDYLTVLLRTTLCLSLSLAVMLLSLSSATFFGTLGCPVYSPPPSMNPLVIPLFSPVFLFLLLFFPIFLSSFFLFAPLSCAWQWLHFPRLFYHRAPLGNSALFLPSTSSLLQ